MLSHRSDSTVVFFIPKAALGAQASEHLAGADQFRPLTLANSCQQLVAKVFNRLLEVVVAKVVCPVQRGFARGGSIVDNLLGIEASTAEPLQDGGADPGAFRFDVAAAFPSAPQAWIWQVLEAMDVPLALRRRLCLLYQGSFVPFSVGGELAKRRVPVLSGIEQGCPSSGSLWALL